MDPNVSGAQRSGADMSPLLVVVGAGPKAAALAAKARVLKKLNPGLEVRILVIERNKIGANWIGWAGFTDGSGELGTPPEKDVGFPYNSAYGSKVDIAMLEYSWHSHRIHLSETSYSDWIDRGKQQPKHKDWAAYLRWVLDKVAADCMTDAPAAQVKVIEETEVKGIEPVGGKLKITAYHNRKPYPIEDADGVVFTGPGEPVMFDNIPAGTRDLMIFDGRSYWQYIDLFRGMANGKIALIGGGETAASIALSLLGLTLVPKGPSLQIDIINRHGAIFTRGESYNENKYFSNPKDWAQLDEAVRTEFIQRTDRGVFSLAAQRQLDRAENVSTISGRVLALDKAGGKVIVRLERGEPPVGREYEYDKVIVALGFNPWSPLELLPANFRPNAATAADLEKLRVTLRRGIDDKLRLPFDYVPGLAGTKINIHMPMLAGLSQGPGFPNLSCLGHLSDRILSAYV